MPNPTSTPIPDPDLTPTAHSRPSKTHTQSYKRTRSHPKSSRIRDDNVLRPRNLPIFCLQSTFSTQAISSHLRREMRLHAKYLTPDFSGTWGVPLTGWFFVPQRTPPLPTHHRCKQAPATCRKYRQVKGQIPGQIKQAFYLPFMCIRWH